MNRLAGKLSIVLLSATVAVFSSCNSDEKKEPMGSSSTTSRAMAVPGVAGGITEDTFTETATVTGINYDKRQVTLTGEADKPVTFQISPEVKNFDQIQRGDKVTAEVTERVTVFVRSTDEDPAVTHAAALATAPKGAKPGMMMGQSVEITGKVKSIDTTTRKATIEFSDGVTRTVDVRPDVDLSRYNVGDTVVVRVSEAISILTKAP